ncbi:hypothetical protein Tco_1075026 [Tanacetum coccineum]
MDYTTSQLYDDIDIRLNEPVDTNKEFVQGEGIDAAMTNVQQENENLEIIQVIENAYLTLSTVSRKTKVPVTSSSHSSDLAAKFLNFSDILHTDAEIISPIDVYVHHESHGIGKRSCWLKKDLLHTQVIALVDDHFDTRLGETREEFMNFLSESLTTRITEQIKNQLPQILPEEVSNFAHPVIQKMVQELLGNDVLAKEFSQPQSLYEAAATLTEFELKKILIDKMDKSKSYLAAPEHKECYEGLRKSYDLDKTFLDTYEKVYSLKRSKKDKDKDEDPSAGSDRGLKKRNTNKDAEPTKEEPEFEVADLNMPQDQEENLGKDDEEPKEKVAPKRDWFTKPTQPEEPTGPD